MVLHSIRYFIELLRSAALSLLSASYYTKFYIPQDITTCDMSPCDLSAIARIAQKAIQSSKDGQVDLVKLLETAIKRASLVDYPLFEDSSDTGTVTRPKKQFQSILNRLSLFSINEDYTYVWYID